MVERIIPNSTTPRLLFLFLVFHSSSRRSDGRENCSKFLHRQFSEFPELPQALAVEPLQRSFHAAKGSEGDQGPVFCWFLRAVQKSLQSLNPTPQTLQPLQAYTQDSLRFRKLPWLPQARKRLLHIILVLDATPTRNPTPDPLSMFSEDDPLQRLKLQTLHLQVKFWTADVNALHLKARTPTPESQNLAS